MEQEMVCAGSKTLSGENTFRLYDTFGFPVDLTAEILEEKGFTYDEAGFLSCMEEQRRKARSARKTTNYMGADASVYEQMDPALTSVFVGYDQLENTSRVCAMVHTKVSADEADMVTDALSEGETGTIIADETVFYATMGGQIGDSGKIVGENGVFAVKDTISAVGGKIVHIGQMVSGRIAVGEKVMLSVDADRRKAIAKNHSATHLLQKALREVLGSHVQQAGSDVKPDRLRFDFTHFSAMTEDEIRKVEEIVNDQIALALPVVTQVMGLDEAKKTGAMALFGEKYGESVRVVKMGDFSVELCGGTHVSNTGEVAAFKIISEAGVASGVRRIEALTSKEVFAYYDRMEQQLLEAAELAKAAPAALTEKISHLLAEIKELRSENESLKSKAAKDAMGNIADKTQKIGNISFLAAALSDVDMNGLRELGDDLKKKMEDSVIVLASEKDGKVTLLAMATDGAMKQGAHAGNLIKGIAGLVGGGGGGRANMAQAGGKNSAGIEAALAEAKKVLEHQLQSQ